MTGLIVLIGSGELAPSMNSTYHHLFEHVQANSITVLDSSYGFQENADDLTRRIEQHFQQGFSLETKVASLRRRGTVDEERDRFLEEVERAEVVFAGPGSPSYANRIWSELPLGAALTSVVDRGGAVVMASAAAITLGAKAIPVYEIYKVGAEPVWLDGLDVLSSYGLAAAIVPHWNNREGGSHDTSRCFIGTRRFRELVRALPPEISVLGIDEHTSVSIHADSGIMRVMGVGQAHLNDLDFAGQMSVSGFVPRPALPALEPEPRSPSPWDPVIDLLVELRNAARAEGDFALADTIRKRLAAAGVELRDAPDRTTWHRPLPTR